MDQFTQMLFEGSYLEKLRKRTEENRIRHEERALQLQEAKRPLPERIKDWFDRLTPEQRQQTYTMQQLTTVFKVSPAQIGSALHLLAWQRQRSYKKGMPFARSWTPPSN